MTDNLAAEGPDRGYEAPVAALLLEDSESVYNAGKWLDYPTRFGLIAADVPALTRMSVDMARTRRSPGASKSGAPSTPGALWASCAQRDRCWPGCRACERPRRQEISWASRAPVPGPPKIGRKATPKYERVALFPPRHGSA